ncbi:MAG: NAD(P)H-hydrate dehydratase [Pseudomonadota bacterium]
MNDAQVLTADQMRAAEQKLFDAGISVSDLMETAAGGAAEWVRRIVAGGSVTILCGPGNNGGDGYVIARVLYEAGLDIEVIAPVPPRTQAAQTARARWSGPVLTSGTDSRRDVLVDCLFGSGLTRPLSAEHNALLLDLAQRHTRCVAIDMPSGIASDTGEALNDRLPQCDVTLALGAWKVAHCLAASRALLGTIRLVPIGIDAVAGAMQRVTRPNLAPPSTHAHKYTRGLLAVIGGTMPGASLLAAKAAMRAGAGYVKWFAQRSDVSMPASLVRDTGALADALADQRLTAICIGPGVGRDDAARAAVEQVMQSKISSVLDADALHCLKPSPSDPQGARIATPHDGELEVLCRTFGVIAEGRMAKAQALARVSAMVIVAKGPDTFIAAPDGRLAIGPHAPSWLSVAGSGDVLAGIIASRLATGADPFAAASEGLWLHSEAARQAGAAFTPDDLADHVSGAVAACL